MPRKKRDPLWYIAEPLRPLAEPLDHFTPDPRNAREHPEENLAAIAASLKRFGQRKPLVCNRATGHIESGNGVRLAAEQLGWSHLAVVWVEDDPAAETGFALADNRAAELAGWNNDTLQVLLAELHGDDDQLYAALRFEALRGDLEGAAGETSQPEEAEAAEAAVENIVARWAVVIECGSQEEQQTVYEECSAAGRTCRLLTM